jgi:hypothetical protein
MLTRIRVTGGCETCLLWACLHPTSLSDTRDRPLVAPLVALLRGCERPTSLHGCVTFREMADDELADVPSFTTGTSFFDANSQAHHKPLSAFGSTSQMMLEKLTQSGCGSTASRRMALP